MTRPMPGPPECECATSKTGLTVYTLRCQLHSPFSVAHLALRPPKRLTDAECAAERGEARADWMYMKFLIASRQIVSMRARPNKPLPEPSPPLERKLNEARDRHYTWHRFAATPHALEEA